MSGEKYERPAGFPDWVESEDDETLVGEAEAFKATERVLSSKKSCIGFVSIQRSLLPVPSAGKFLFLMIFYTL